MGSIGVGPIGDLAVKPQKTCFRVDLYSSLYKI